MLYNTLKFAHIPVKCHFNRICLCDDIVYAVCLLDCWFRTIMTFYMCCPFLLLSMPLIWYGCCSTSVVASDVCASCNSVELDVYIYNNILSPCLLHNVPTFANLCEIHFVSYEMGVLARIASKWFFSSLLLSVQYFFPASKTIRNVYRYNCTYSFSAIPMELTQI